MRQGLPLVEQTFTTAGQWQRSQELDQGLPAARYQGCSGVTSRYGSGPPAAARPRHYRSGVRTWFEIEETDVYLTARETLLRRCEAWAAARGLTMAPSLAEALLDSRHFSTDGRLGYWTPAQVERALLHWIPGKVTAAPQDLLGAPETLRTLLRYLQATGLRDPRGATVAENEAAIDAAAAEFSAAIADPDKYGLAKTMALAAGLDQPEALEDFLQSGPESLPDVDPEVVQAAMARQARLPALNAERRMPQLPVRLPARAELAVAAGRSKVACQFRALAEWLGPQGRALTPAKNIRPADARELITLLGTGDEGLKFRSAAELPGLNLVVSWALEARLIRRQGTRLLPVPKARPLLADAEALWQRAFEAAFAIGDAACRPTWADEPPSPVQQTYDLVVPDVLATIYSMEEPVPVPRLAESVWQGVEARFDLDHVSSFLLKSLRARTDRDVEHIFDAFEALGAVTSVRAMADGMFLQDLANPAASPFDRAGSAALRRQLKEPVRLVSLTPLGTRAMRERMLAEGREAALVGELADAAPAEMLGVVAEHYTDASAAEEVARWREAHGGSLDPLVQAIDDCPFVTRRVALLQALASAVPEGSQLLTDLARDPEHRPVALLTRRTDLRPPDATPEEATWMMIGTLLELLELGGPEAVSEQLAQLPPGQRKECVRTVLASGFPVPETLEEFRSLVAAPLLHGPPRLHPAADVTRTQRTRPKRPRRR
jgi:hypothetical protein